MVESRKNTKDFGLPPTEASENLRSLEIDKRTLRKTNRIHQFNTSVSKEWMEKLKAIAYEERLKYVEVLEKALESYENQKQIRSTKKLSTQVKVIEKKSKSQPKLNPYPYSHFICDNCQNEYKQETAYSYARNSEEFEYSSTYCSNCVK
jgi:hypothetical protein